MRALDAGRPALDHAPARPPSRALHTSIAAVVRVAAAAALAVDAWVHATGSSIYDPPGGGLLTEGNLFRAEAVAAALVALSLLWRPSLRTWLVALLVAASALTAVVLYRYVDVGAIGPIPDLYEPTWQVPGKLVSACAEGAAVLLSSAGALLALPATQIFTDHSSLRMETHDRAAAPDR